MHPRKRLSIKSATVAGIAASVLLGLTGLALNPAPAKAVVYCQYVEYPTGCVARAGVVLRPRRGRARPQRRWQCKWWRQSRWGAAVKASFAGHERERSRHRFVPVAAFLSSRRGQATDSGRHHAIASSPRRARQRADDRQERRSTADGQVSRYENFRCRLSLKFWGGCCFAGSAPRHHQFEPNHVSTVRRLIRRGLGILVLPSRRLQRRSARVDC